MLDDLYEVQADVLLMKLAVKNGNGQVKRSYQNVKDTNGRATGAMPTTTLRHQGVNKDSGNK